MDNHATLPTHSFTTLQVSLLPLNDAKDSNAAQGAGVGIITMNRPSKGNAQTDAFWEDLPAALHHLQHDLGARCIIINANGRHFCTGIDLSVLGGEFVSAEAAACEGRARFHFITRLTSVLQAAMTAIERCNCPVISAIHGICYGAGIDLITACDIRICTEDSRFSIKEVDLGLAADMGTLARLPFIVGDGIARELAITAREFSGKEALRMNLVSQAFASKEELFKGAVAMATSIATSKSPLALVGTKRMLLYQRGRTVGEGLRAVATWNAAMLPGSADIAEVFTSRAEGRVPRFSKL